MPPNKSNLQIMYSSILDKDYLKMINENYAVFYQNDTNRK